MKKLAALVLVVALLVTIVATQAIANAPKKSIRLSVDKSKPVHATNVEFGKKLTLKGKASKGRTGVVLPFATGTLGETGTGDSSKKYAIIVGISDYPGTYNDLQYCDDDARDMHDTLVKVYNFNESNISLLINAAATRSAVVDAIRNVLAQNPEEVVFFFSSHGTRGMANDGDAEKVDEAVVAYDQVIWDGELKSEFDNFSPSTRISFVFDTCYAGGMTDLKSTNRVVSMACGEKQTSVEYSSIQNGEFTYQMVQQGMLNGLANTHPYGDGITGQPNQTTVEEAFDYAVANCSYDHPTISDLFTDDLLY